MHTCWNWMDGVWNGFHDVSSACCLVVWWYFATSECSPFGAGGGGLSSSVLLNGSSSSIICNAIMGQTSARHIQWTIDNEWRTSTSLDISAHHNHHHHHRRQKRHNGKRGWEKLKSNLSINCFSNSLASIWTQSVHKLYSTHSLCMYLR